MKKLTRFTINILKKNNKQVFVVAQTTFDTKEMEKCVKKIKKLCTNAKIFDTICNATSVRQTEADLLAAQSDFMVVIGDRHSSNTGKLFDICKRQCDNTVLIETADELDALQVSVAEKNWRYCRCIYSGKDNKGGTGYNE